MLFLFFGAITKINLFIFNGDQDKLRLNKLNHLNFRKKILL